MIRLLCKLDEISDIINELELQYTNIEKIQVVDFDFTLDENNRFYFSPSKKTCKTFDVLHMDKINVWKLDKYQSCLHYCKDHIIIDNVEYIIYVRRNTNIKNIDLEPLNKISAYCSCELQLKMCDIYLMIPGKISLNNKVYPLNKSSHPMFDVFKSSIEESINNEYSSDFFKNMDRAFLFESTIKITSVGDKSEFLQNGLVCIAIHPSGFCILEIMLPCCVIGGNKLLNYYCGEGIEIKYKGFYYSIDALFKEIGIRRFGKKRSMVFNYGEISKEETVNALANEEFPMGNIDGDFFRMISSKNIAQYDTAKVYVSSETVLEVCSYINIFPDKRILYHVIEIFFVEMILFQDASIDKIHVDLHNIYQKVGNDVSLAIQRSEEISFDMTQALKFADYNYFLFPSVRESAKTISKAFGLEQIYEKYEHDKYLIDSIIKSIERKTQEKQDKIKNRFLFLISALTTIGVLGEIIHFFFEDAYVSMLSYLTALLIVSVFYVCYRIIIKLKNK